MIDVILRRIFGTKHERDVKRITPTVVASNAFEPSVLALGDAELQAKTDGFRKRLEAGQPLEKRSPDALTRCRAPGRAALGFRQLWLHMLVGSGFHQGH